MLFGLQRSRDNRMYLHASGEPVAEFDRAIPDAQLAVIMAAINAGASQNILSKGVAWNGSAAFGAIRDNGSGKLGMHYRGVPVAKFNDELSLTKVESLVAEVDVGVRQDLLDVGVAFQATPWTPAQVTTGKGVWAEGAEFAGTTTLTAMNDRFSGGLGAWTPTGTPARNTGDANYVGGVSFGVLEASTQYVTGPGAASAYRAWHNGTGFTAGGTAKCTDGADATQVMLASMNMAGANIGAGSRFTGDGFRWLIQNGSAALVDFTIAAVAPANTPFSWAFEFADRSPGVTGSGIDDWRFWVNKVLVHRGEIATTDLCSAADPAGVGRLCSRSPTFAASDAFEGTVGSFIWFQGCASRELAHYVDSIKGV